MVGTDQRKLLCADKSTGQRQPQILNVVYLFTHLLMKTFWTFMVASPFKNKLGHLIAVYIFNLFFKTA